MGYRGCLKEERGGRKDGTIFRPLIKITPASVTGEKRMEKNKERGRG